MSTNYYLVTEVEDGEYEIIHRKHIGKISRYFMMQIQPEWDTIDECLTYLRKMEGKKERFINQRVFTFPQLKDEYGHYVTVDELETIIKEANKITLEEFTKTYGQYKHFSLDNGVVYSYGEFS